MTEDLGILSTREAFEEEVVDSRGSYVLKILYVETKESGPLGGRELGTPPRSANGCNER